MKIKSITSVVLASAALLSAPLAAKDAGPAAESTPKVQIAILLDNSGSMSGLIQQAKTQLWKIVNEFIAAKQNGKTPFVEVALYCYGNASDIRRIQPLTRDLDKVSQELFALTINGGDEYCGTVIHKATAELEWDPSPGTYKVIFIAGNEPFTQGAINPDTSCKEAVSKGIIVNTIHCGPEAEGREGGWHKGALLADGKFLNIDQNAAVAHIDAPQDVEIAKLSEQLNKTYLWYGSHAEQKRMNQLAQDGNADANKAAGAPVQRAASKASGNYWNADADLVDASKDAKFELTKVKEEELPEEMRKMTAEERASHVKAKTDERVVIQKKILELTNSRETWVAGKLKEQGKETLDTAVTKAIRDQAGKKQIMWEKN